MFLMHNAKICCQWKNLILRYDMPLGLLKEREKELILNSSTMYIDDNENNRVMCACSLMHHDRILHIINAIGMHACWHCEKIPFFP